MGADVFCDSRLIAAEIAGLAANPELNPFSASAEVREQADRYEGELFWAAITSIPPTRILRKLFSELSFGDAFRFLKDRAGVAKSARTKPVARGEAVPLYQSHLEDLEQRLAVSGEFLGGPSPAHLDFAAYHTLWFKRVVGGLPMPGGLPLVAAWYERMTAIGHGIHHVGSVEDTFAAARDNAPRPVPEAMAADSRIGEPVRIMPGDYALDATEGTLVGISDERYILARDTEEYGTVHVHLPVAGFEMTS
jgi:glutathione S-transferase